ncbi:hypothetical protein V3C99_001839 [Haemonchus contortus]
MPGRRLFVTGIANTVPEEAIRAYFSQFGPLSEFTLPVERETGLNRGYAYIAFSNETSTAECLEVPTHKIRNREIKVTRLSDEDEEGKLLYYAIITFGNEEAVESCLKLNHCINGRSIVVRKAVTKEQFKLAEQSERERAHLEEHQKHGYAGYNRVRTILVPQQPQLPSMVSAYPNRSYPSQIDLQSEQYRREYEQYLLQMQEYQKQLAEYHEKLNKYHGELQQYQYKTALDQAAFHNAYNYNTNTSRDSSGSIGTNTGAESDVSDRMRNYGYVSQ